VSKVTKETLRQAICDKIGCSSLEAYEFVHSFFEEISVCLEKGESVKIAGFGSFILREKHSRPGRNPRTGEPAEISARTVVRFQPSKQIKNQLREYGE